MGCWWQPSIAELVGRCCQGCRRGWWPVAEGVAWGVAEGVAEGVLWGVNTCKNNLIQTTLRMTELFF